MKNAKFTSESLGALYNDLFGATTCDEQEASDFFTNQLIRYRKHIQNFMNRDFVNFVPEGDRRLINASEAQKTIILLMLEDMQITASGRRLFCENYDKTPLLNKAGKKIADDGFAAVMQTDEPVYLFIELHNAKLIYTLSMRSDFKLHDDVHARLSIPVSAIFRKTWKRHAEITEIMQRYGK